MDTSDRPNLLDHALRELEKRVKDAQHPVRFLREAIEHQRSRGKFDEARILSEVNKILTRTDFAVEDIDNLAQRLMAEAP